MQMSRKAVLGSLVLSVTLGSGFLAGRASAAQPLMNAALDSLRTARRQLAAATSDKGGHRTKALALVDDAISEVEKGIAFDRRH